MDNRSSSFDFIKIVRNIFFAFFFVGFIPLIIIMASNHVYSNSPIWLFLIGDALISLIIGYFINKRKTEILLRKQAEEKATKDNQEYQRKLTNFYQNERVAKAFGKEKGKELASVAQYGAYQAAVLMRQIGGALATPVYQEKERDWAIAGGIASGLAGGVAGVVVAADTMIENQKIRERNAANIATAVETEKNFSKMADNIIAEARHTNNPEFHNTCVSIPMEQLIRELHVNCTVTESNYDARYVMINVSCSATAPAIDGSIRIKLYDYSNRIIGYGYFYLPNEGSVRSYSANVPCMLNKNVTYISKVVTEPSNLWQLCEAEDLSSQEELLMNHEQDVAHFASLFEEEKKHMDYLPQQLDKKQA